MSIKNWINKPTKSSDFFFTNIRKTWKRLKYFLFRKHDWYYVTKYKRICKISGIGQTLYQRNYPEIGEAKYYWKTDPLDDENSRIYKILNEK